MWKAHNCCYVDRLLRDIVTKTKINVIFVATDQDAMINEIDKYLSNEKVSPYYFRKFVRWLFDVTHRSPCLSVDTIATLAYLSIP